MQNLTEFIQTLNQSGKPLGTIPESQWRQFDVTVQTMISAQDWEGLLTLRQLCKPLFARDSGGGITTLATLETEAIRAARELNRQETLAGLLGARGHNLHRLGYHTEAIAVFEESATLYDELNDPFPALKSYYMTALCHRALENRPRAIAVLNDVLQAVDETNSWRGNPVQVLAWLERDNGNLKRAEQLLREAIALQRKTTNPDILVAGSLTDLGEVLTLRGEFVVAEQAFHDALAILSRYDGQYDRQIARTRWKLAKLHIQVKEYALAERELRLADDLASRHGHYYDSLWKIEWSKAQLYLRQGRLKGVLGALWSCWGYRRQLGLSVRLLIRQKLPVLGKLGRG